MKKEIKATTATLILVVCLVMLSVLFGIEIFSESRWYCHQDYTYEVDRNGSIDFGMVPLRDVTKEEESFERVEIIRVSDACGIFDCGHLEIFHDGESTAFMTINVPFVVGDKVVINCGSYKVAVWEVDEYGEKNNIVLQSTPTPIVIQ